MSLLTSPWSEKGARKLRKQEMGGAARGECRPVGDFHQQLF
jgi:hypothetical protein